MAGKTFYGEKLARNIGTVVLRVDDYTNAAWIKHGVKNLADFLAADPATVQRIRTERMAAALKDAQDKLRDPGVNKLVLEHPFAIVEEGKQALQAGQDTGVKVKMAMLFRPDLRTNLESLCERLARRKSIDPVAPGPRDLEIAEKRLKTAAEWERGCADAFDSYVKTGASVDLYENRFEQGLYPVAQGRKGKLNFLDPQAFNPFEAKKYINPDADFQVKALKSENGLEFEVRSSNAFLPSQDASSGVREAIDGMNARLVGR